MKEGDRESSFSAGMALSVETQPEGNPGIPMVQEGGFPASTTWKDGRKRRGLGFVAWGDSVIWQWLSIPSWALTES